MTRLTYRSLRRLSEAIRNIYAAANGDCLPAHILSALSELFPSPSISYNENNLRERDKSVHLFHPRDAMGRDDAALLDAYIYDHPFFHLLHPGMVKTYPFEDRVESFRRRERIFGSASLLGRAVNTSDILTDRQFHKLGIYNDIFKWNNIEYQMMSVVWNSRRRDINICFNRDKDFTGEERLIFSLLSPHVVQAYTKLEFLERMREALAVVTEDANCGMIVLDNNGRFKFLIGAAQHLLTEHFQVPSRSASRLPEELERWVRRSRSLLAQDSEIPPPLTPFIIENEIGRLIVRLVNCRGESGEENLLLLKGEPKTLSIERLKDLGITSREAEVLYWTAQGKSNAQTASILDAAPATIKKHLENIYRKLGVENRTAAVRLAMEKLGMAWV